MSDIYMMCGTTGSGKSTVASIIANITGGLLFVADEIRRDLFASSIKTRLAYSQSATEQTYTLLVQLAAAALKKHVGKPVVLDGTFLTKRLRQKARDLADASNARLIAVICSASHHNKLERLMRRNDDFSAARSIRHEVLANHSAQYEMVIPDEASVIFHILNDGDRRQLSQLVNKMISSVDCR